MKEIDPIAETDYTVETECMTEIGHIVGIDHKTTIKMIIEMTIEKKDHRDFKDQRYMRKHKDYYKDTYDKDNHRISHGNKDRSKDRYQTKTNTEMTAMTKLEVGLKKKITYMMMMMIYLTQKLKECTKCYKLMSQEREMAIGFMLAFSENPDKILDSIHSPADVDHLIAERNECGKSQKAENLTKEPHDNINNTSSQNYVNPVNYAPINVDTGLTQDSVDTVFVEGKVDNYYTETTITCDSEEEVQIQNIEEGNIMVDSHDELDLWEPEQIPHALIRLAEGQILEEFMLEEEIEFQGIDNM